MTTPARDFSRTLYPFLDETPAPDDEGSDALHAEVRQSTREKCRDVVSLRRSILDEYAGRMVQAAEAMAAAFAAGGTLLAFGNGGSATDAQDAATDCLQPPLAGWTPLPAIALVDDTALITAIGNDVGFEHVFVRQIIAYANPNDIALAFSTSGSSPSITAGMAEARRRGLLTIALSGHDGGELARSSGADFCFIARVAQLPRIQEGHATVWHALLEMVQDSLARKD